jgi:AcrR family transcriptional regulator
MPPRSDATGVTRRRTRLSDAESARRMLDTALRLVAETGLTVSLEHLSLEEVIRESGVSRTAVYRRWPYKDLFFSDLLAELAAGPAPMEVVESPATALARQVLLDRLDLLRTPAGRRELLIELCRQAAMADVDDVTGSPAWRTHVALHATVMGLPDTELRRRVQGGLAAAGARTAARLSARYREGAEALGYRLAPGSGVTVEVLATMGGAVMTGFVVASLAGSEPVAQRFPARPFGAAREAEWTSAALAIAGLLITHLEPDPAVGGDWDDARLDAVRRRLEG